jgi:glycosyltransferase involved in cell wall biosynthesis
MLPIGVIVPTKNSAAFLPGHLESMRAWLDLVTQVVVVDSYSTDGTMDLIRSGLHHPNLQLLTHPPGLYQSWNYAIKHLSTDYAYIATIGDGITREGLQRLHATAESLGCDVLISKPSFHNTKGEHLPDFHWPIDEIMHRLRLKQPRRLKQLEVLAFALTDVSGALSSSCASDLFRTKVLQRHPFPTEFGTAGDAAWSLLHALDVSWGVTSDRFSSFLVHSTSASEAERRSYEQSERLDLVARRAVRLAREAGIISREELEQGRIDELLNAVSSYLDSKQEFDRLRRGRLPWIVMPAAWRTRAQRNQLRTQLQEAKERTFAALGSQP